MVNKKEVDPSGKDPHQAGSKLDAGKPRVSSNFLAYFPRAIEAVASVSDFGAKKYTRMGWATVPDGATRYADAGLRHTIKRAKGEILDPDSGLSHLAHEAWNALACLELELLLKERENDANKNATQQASGQAVAQELQGGYTT